MLEEGTPVRAIARHFNVGVATIDRIKNISACVSRNLSVLTASRELGQVNRIHKIAVSGSRQPSWPRLSSRGL
ncbi:MAG: helix-turn-helix domain-containing protein, partial [Sphingomonadales bacterium]|nr:helix-turn-helix domain-containing protein [Sphingomonadales bacterium]